MAPSWNAKSAIGIRVRIPSPVQFQRELQLPGSPLVEQWRAGVDDRPRRGVPDLRIGVIELRRVQHIESLGAKLQAMACALIEGEIFEHGEINLSGSRSEENVSSRVPEYVIARRNKI